MIRPLLLSATVALTLIPCLAQDVTGAQGGPVAVGTTKPAKSLTNDAVVRMSKAGLDEDILLQTIRTQPGAYATGPDDLIALKNEGLSQVVISAMLAKNSGLAEHPEPAVKPVEVAPVSSQIDDIGVYYKLRESRDWQNMPLELVNYRQGGALKSIVTNNIIKKDMNGHIAGPRGKLQLKGGDTLLINAPGGTEPEEYLFLKFREHSDNREFRTETGNVFHSQTGADRDAVPFTAHKIAPHMYTVELPENLAPGEYGVLPPGNVNQRGMANAGKIYTFAVSK